MLLQKAPKSFTIPRTGLITRPILPSVPNYLKSYQQALVFGEARKMSSIAHVSTKEACPPAGPYSQAIKAAGQIYVSGQIPADKTGALVEGTIGDKTEAVITNIRAILKAANSDIEKVVKCNVFITDMANFGEVNEVYEKHFSHRPARSCVAVKQLPKGVPVEIECIALQ